MIEQSPVGAALVSTHQKGGFHLFVADDTQKQVKTKSQLPYYIIPEGRTYLFPQKGDPWSGADVSGVHTATNIRCTTTTLYWRGFICPPSGRHYLLISKTVCIPSCLACESSAWSLHALFNAVEFACNAQPLNQSSFLFSVCACCACLEVAIVFHYEPWPVTLVYFCGPPPILECHQAVYLWGPPMVATNKSEAHALVTHQRWSNPGPATWSCSIGILHCQWQFHVLILVTVCGLTIGEALKHCCKGSQYRMRVYDLAWFHGLWEFYSHLESHALLTAYIDLGGILKPGAAVVVGEIVLLLVTFLWGWQMLMLSLGNW